MRDEPMRGGHELADDIMLSKTNEGAKNPAVVGAQVVGKEPHRRYSRRRPTEKRWRFVERQEAKILSRRTEHVGELTYEPDIQPCRW
ncbi:hypothetical protein COMA2_10341 [Candidatus Nitrospira nitrificans]|uniref:Uncharacterized protein n=1 Tax=Candidatus Nitrospira nitrificans TaxID=1742973 RepID=A0A0S4L2H8_9BACT|nr:hypothetical protein COMA2_10341 [Candidatus Nitrospira nitrificans]